MPSKAVTEERLEALLSLIAGESGGGGPEKHVIKSSVTVCTSQGIPLMLTETLSTTFPKPDPVILRRVPPSLEPTLG